MTNNGKLSKVMLLAGALIFASFHSFPVRAEDNGVTLGEVVSTAVGAYPDIIDVTTASGRLQEEQYKNKKAYEEAQKNITQLWPKRKKRFRKKKPNATETRMIVRLMMRHAVICKLFRAMITR